MCGARGGHVCMYHANVAAGRFWLQARMPGEGMSMRKITRTTIALGTGVVLVLASLVSMVALGPRTNDDADAAPAEAPDAAPAEAPAAAEPEATDSEAGEKDADAERDAYVATWAERIDAFNAGYPLEGYGETFAAAAYEYGIDPRYSPAIARVESGSGLNCAYAYNAWGWGAADENPVGLALEWSSWEEAIDAHIRGLSNAYGYTISLGGAKSYCTDWKNWYPNTLSEMSVI